MDVNKIIYSTLLQNKENNVPCNVAIQDINIIIMILSQKKKMFVLFSVQKSILYQHKQIQNVVKHVNITYIKTQVTVQKNVINIILIYIKN